MRNVLPDTVAENMPQTDAATFSTVVIALASVAASAAAQ